ncbi:tRNA (guanosine(46)-N7)-methyltransferase TrmB [Alkalicoccus luteus]|uniref:tRNA (guanine-N(7)-)-methyltransferase n=1 Tax=Alkalicoccus luteus TaxID=1237094 RepID=A0A969PMJ1_9BACI|nr:tRNA (guanosine(46)-N7)-methyltransferase TrmB [Alkalicoccus luteus]NJP36950.1 tRNA (guanosine(46)-N7)-methyltransferase TrmB [Alkalicoccus luteus]
MRLRNKPWAPEYLKENNDIVVEEASRWKGKWHDHFGNNHPLYVEIGSGKGKFVNELAEANPDINVIGLELYESVIVNGVERAVENRKPNLRFLQENAADLPQMFAAGEIDRLYINFTDPWPKKRHAKRRLTHEGFLELYREVLHREAEIHFKTDNQGLFEFSLESLSSSGAQLKNISLDLHQSEMEGNIMTEYEQKFSQKGMRIYRLEARLHHD